jgi:regulator of protease activity HflC (stomatin/prohibitin superfamily)
MDSWFILFIVLGALALIAVAATAALWKSAGDEDARGPLVAITSALWLLAAGALFAASFTTIPTKTVGIETLYGKPTTVLTNGWHWKNPVAQVHKFDASLQSDHYSTDKDDTGDPITVRLFTGSQAQLNVTFQWKLEDNANFTQVFVNYREPERIRQNLVKRNLQQALNDVFESYNPYAALIAAQQAGNASPGTVQVGTSFDRMGVTALERLRSELAPQGVQAVSLTIASIVYDGKTQGNLDGLSSAIAQTQIATQNKATAQQQADANALLNAKPATAQTLTQLCIQATQKVLEEGRTLPTGWNCFGPSGVPVTATK